MVRYVEECWAKGQEAVVPAPLGLTACAACRGGEQKTVSSAVRLRRLAASVPQQNCCRRDVQQGADVQQQMHLDRKR